MKKKMIRSTTIPLSVSGLLPRQLGCMANHFKVLGVSLQGQHNELGLMSKLEPTLIAATK